MQNTYNDIVAKLQTIPALRYINWDIGQLDGYYLKPSVTFPCALISFVQIQLQDIGDDAQLADVVMNIKLCTEKLSQTSNLAPLAVRNKGNEVWQLHQAIRNVLHAKDGTYHNTISQSAITPELREDGLHVLNCQYTFMVEQVAAVPNTHYLTPMGAAVVLPTIPVVQMLPPMGSCYVADFATFNSNTYLDTWVNAGGSYKYKCTGYSLNGIAHFANIAQQFSKVLTDIIKVQAAPFDTISAYNTDSFHYDKNWLDFIQYVFATIGFDMVINTSPFDAMHDAAYPNLAIAAPVYGEAFQLAWAATEVWWVDVEYAYIDANNVEQTLHTIRYTNDAMLIDGAAVPLANKTIVTL